MTGRPAETWRKFTFRTAPDWTYALWILIIFGLLGIILAAIIARAVSLKASGHLPLTRSSSRIAVLAQRIPISLVIGGIALITLIVVAAIANVGANNSNLAALGAIGVLLGIFALVAGLVGLLVAPWLLPRARVAELPGYRDRVVEFRNAHPNFVTAVLRQHQERQAQPTGQVQAS
ncbi:MAG TPA: hypothetical protein VNA65_10320 [Candidatus Dormibacteraeota bacterium]|nr:hypothetical protein [Candidatus Dormibacteraeota bacterium]